MTKTLLCLDEHHRSLLKAMVEKRQQDMTVVAEAAIDLLAKQEGIEVPKIKTKRKVKVKPAPHNPHILEDDVIAQAIKIWWKRYEYCDELRPRELYFKLAAYLKKRSELDQRWPESLSEFSRHLESIRNNLQLCMWKDARVNFTWKEVKGQLIYQFSKSR